MSGCSLKKKTIFMQSGKLVEQNIRPSRGPSIIINRARVFKSGSGLSFQKRPG